MTAPGNRCGGWSAYFARATARRVVILAEKCPSWSTEQQAEFAAKFAKKEA